MFAAAAFEDRTIVTENFNDSLVCLRIARGEEVATVAFACKADLPRDCGALTAEPADRLERRAADHPDPFPTAYWL